MDDFTTDFLGETTEPTEPAATVEVWASHGGGVLAHLDTIDVDTIEVRHRTTVPLGYPYQEHVYTLTDTTTGDRLLRAERRLALWLTTDGLRYRRPVSISVDYGRPEVTVVAHGMVPAVAVDRHGHAITTPHLRTIDVIQEGPYTNETEYQDLLQQTCRAAWQTGHLPEYDRPPPEESRSQTPP